MHSHSDHVMASNLAASRGAASTPSVAVSDAETLAFVQTIVQAADERKGADILVLKVAEVSTLADYFVIVTGFSKVQIRAIANSIKDAAQTECHRQPRQTEGQTDATWILQDYGDVMVHILLPDERDYYNLEAFWGHAERLNVGQWLRTSAS